MKRSVVAISSATDSEKAFQEVTEKIKKECSSPKLIVFFSDSDSFYFYTTKLHEAFPSTTTIGTTTYLSFCSAGICHTGLSAMAINDGIECSSGILFEISNYPKHYFWHIMTAMEKLGSLENTCCLEFCTAFSNGEELVLDTFREMFAEKQIPIFGGSSGPERSDNKITYVSLDGVCYRNTCVFVLIKNLQGKIVFVQENLFKNSGKIFSVTDVDVDKRTVYELDNKPAADVLATALDIPLDELQRTLAVRPLGRVFNDKIFITEPEKIMSDGSISMFAQVFNNTKLAILERDNIQDVWNRTVQEAKSLLPGNSFGFVINCLARSKLFEQEKLIDDYVKTLSENYGNYIGLSGYGEQYNFVHMNQTMILALFE